MIPTGPTMAMLRRPSYGQLFHGSGGRYPGEESCFPLGDNASGSSLLGGGNACRFLLSPRHNSYMSGFLFSGDADGFLLFSSGGIVFFPGSLGTMIGRCRFEMYPYIYYFIFTCTRLVYRLYHNFFVAKDVQKRCESTRLIVLAT